MRTYRVYFRDGNQKLLEAENILGVVGYLLYVYIPNYNADDLVKIEEV